MGRLKRGLMGAVIGVLPGGALVALITLDEVVRGPAEWHLGVAVFGILIAIIGLIVGTIVGATR